MTTNPNGVSEGQQDGVVERDDVNARRVQFDADQKARAIAFEREQNAAQSKAARDEQESADKAEQAARIAANTAENDEAALSDGFITHEDLLRRKDILSQNHGAMLPHEALIEGEPTVKMAFPRTVILTHSADDVRRMQGVDVQDVGTRGVVRDNSGRVIGDEGQVGVVSPISAIAPGSRVLFWKGYHDVAAYMADHSWLRDNGAYPVGKDGSDNSKPAVRPADQSRDELHDTNDAGVS